MPDAKTWALRQLVAHRRFLGQRLVTVKNTIRGVLNKRLLACPYAELFGPSGRRWLGAGSGSRRRGRASGHKGWVVIAASLALLGMLGTAPGSDVLAHVFGLLVGGLLGIGPALAQRRPLGRWSQWLLALAAGALVLACWRIALAAMSRP
jgi:hypothetical protein